MLRSTPSTRNRADALDSTVQCLALAVAVVLQSWRNMLRSVPDVTAFRVRAIVLMLLLLYSRDWPYLCFLFFSGAVWVWVWVRGLVLEFLALRLSQLSSRARLSLPPCVGLLLASDVSALAHERVNHVMSQGTL